MSAQPPPISGPPPMRGPGGKVLPPGASGSPRAVPGLANSPLMRREVSSPIINRMKGTGPQPSSPLSGTPSSTSPPADSVQQSPPKFHAPPAPGTPAATPPAGPPKFHAPPAPGTPAAAATPPRFHAPPAPGTPAATPGTPASTPVHHTPTVTPHPALLGASRAAAAVSSPQLMPPQQQQQQRSASPPAAAAETTPTTTPTAPATTTAVAAAPMPRTVPTGPMPRTVPMMTQPAQPPAPVQTMPRKPPTAITPSQPQPRVAPQLVASPQAQQPQTHPQQPQQSPMAGMSRVSPATSSASSISPATPSPSGTPRSPSSFNLSSPATGSPAVPRAGGADRDAVTRTMCDYMIHELERGIRLQKTPEFTDTVCSISADHTELIVSPLIFEGTSAHVQPSGDGATGDDSAQQTSADGTKRNMAASTRYPIRAIERVQDNRGPDGKLALSVVFRRTADLNLLPITFQSKDRMAFVNFVDGIGALLGYAPQTKERNADLKTIAEIFELTQQYGAPPVPPPPA